MYIIFLIVKIYKYSLIYIIDMFECYWVIEFFKIDYKIDVYCYR